MSMIPSIQFLIDLEGETLTWKAVTRTYNTRGDAEETTSSSTFVGVVIKATNPNRTAHIFGDFQNEDLVFYAKTEIDKGDYIRWNSTDYRIISIRNFDGVYAYQGREEIGYSV